MPTIHVSITQPCYLFQPGMVLELEDRVAAGEYKDRPVEGYPLPDTGDGTPGVLPLSCAEVVGAPEREEGPFSGGCTLTGVWTLDAGGHGVIPREFVTMVSTPDFQQLIFPFPRPPGAEVRLLLVDGRSGAVLEDQAASQKTGSGVLVQWDLLPYPPGFYTIEARGPEGWIHRITFIKFGRGFPRTVPYDYPQDEVEIRPSGADYPTAPERVLGEKDGQPVTLSLAERETALINDLHRLSGHEYAHWLERMKATGPWKRNPLLQWLQEEHGLEYWLAHRLTHIFLDHQERNRPKLEFTGAGRSGILRYVSPEASFNMVWEMAGGNALLVIDIPTPASWESWTGIGLDKRTATLEFIGQEVVDTQTWGGSFRIGEDVLTIYGEEIN